MDRPSDLSEWDKDPRGSLLLRPAFHFAKFRKGIDFLWQVPSWDHRGEKFVKPRHTSEKGPPGRACNTPVST